MKPGIAGSARGREHPVTAVAATAPSPEVTAIGDGQDAQDEAALAAIELEQLTAAFNASLAEVQRLAIEINSDDHAELEQELEDTKKASKALKSLKKRPEELGELEQQNAQVNQQLQEAQVVLQKARVMAATAATEDFAQLRKSGFYKLLPVSMQQGVESLVVDQPKGIAGACSKLVTMLESIMEEYGVESKQKQDYEKVKTERDRLSKELEKAIGGSKSTVEQRVEQLDKDLRNESKENAELKKKNNDLEKELTEEKEKRRTDGLQLAKQASMQFQGGGLDLSLNSLPSVTPSMTGREIALASDVVKSSYMDMISGQYGPRLKKLRWTTNFPGKKKYYDVNVMWTVEFVGGALPGSFHFDTCESRDKVVGKVRGELAGFDLDIACNGYSTITCRPGKGCNLEVLLLTLKKLRERPIYLCAAETNKHSCPGHDDHPESWECTMCLQIFAKECLKRCVDRAKIGCSGFPCPKCGPTPDNQGVQNTTGRLTPHTVVSYVDTKIRPVLSPILDGQPVLVDFLCQYYVDSSVRSDPDLCVQLLKFATTILQVGYTEESLCAFQQRNFGKFRTSMDSVIRHIGAAMRLRSIVGSMRQLPAGPYFGLTPNAIYDAERNARKELMVLSEYLRRPLGPEFRNSHEQYAAKRMRDATKTHLTTLLKLIWERTCLEVHQPVRDTWIKDISEAAETVLFFCSFDLAKCAFGKFGGDASFNHILCKWEFSIGYPIESLMTEKFLAITCFANLTDWAKSVLAGVFSETQKKCVAKFLDFVKYYMEGARRLYGCEHCWNECQEYEVRVGVSFDEYKKFAPGVVDDEPELNELQLEKALKRGVIRHTELSFIRAEHWHASKQRKEESLKRHEKLLRQSHREEKVFETKKARTCNIANNCGKYSLGVCSALWELFEFDENGKVSVSKFDYANHDALEPSYNAAKKSFQDMFGDMLAKMGVKVPESARLPASEILAQFDTALPATTNRVAPPPSRADILASYGVPPSLVASMNPGVAPPPQPKREREDDGMTVRELLQYFEAVPTFDPNVKTELSKHRDSFMHNETVLAYCKALCHALGKNFIEPNQLKKLVKAEFPDIVCAKLGKSYLVWNESTCALIEKENKRLNPKTGKEVSAALPGFFMILKPEATRLLEHKKNKN